MANRVESQESRVEGRRRKGEGGRGSKLRPFPHSAFRIPGYPLGAAIRRRGSRRGVLLLVVLSMLVLFMLIGTAFLMTSNQYRTGMKASAKLNRVGNFPTDLLDRGLMQVLRDTTDPNSSIRYHSLLGDLYGVDGFEAVVYRPATVNLTAPNNVGQVTRFAGAIDGTVQEQLGPTQGQLIDIYVRQLAFSANDPLTPTINESNTVPPNPRHVLKLERDINGQPQILTLPLTKGYYDGCLLTITSGPARGQSTRIVDYDYIADIGPNLSNPVRATRLFRFRVMAFSRADGLPLQIDPDRPPELSDLAGATFLVNGRPYNGTGVGYNPLSVAGQPRLTAVEVMEGLDGTPANVGAEVALTPNARYLTLPALVNAGSYNLAPQDPFLVGGAPANFTPLNDLSGATPIVRYPSFSGLGDTDESYDAADFQNMFLALQTVTPRARGRVVTEEGTFEIDDPSITGAFLRLDLEDLPLPSFHRPALVNFWFHRMLAALGGSDDDVRAILQPYGADAIRDNGDDPTGVPLGVRDRIVALKRKISLRPLREDHPNFNGSNPLSRGISLSGNLVVNGNIAIPYWEAVGPWDVDNDNDAVPDSNWVDLGEPVQQAEDGTLYKPLYAFLIVDLDSRLNVNAHGLAQDIHADKVDVELDPSFITPFNPALGKVGNLAHDVNPPLAAGAVWTSDMLPTGLGYGPAEISLRPVFPVPWNALAEGFRLEDSDNDGGQDYPGDQELDDYATLLAGRVRTGGPGGSGREAVTGRYGFDPTADFTDLGPFGYDAAAGVTSVNTSTFLFGSPDVAAAFKFFGYPNSVYSYDPTRPTYLPSAFGTPPDLMGRYALGLDYTGQPTYEHAAEVRDRPLVADSPYELDLSSDRRRGPRADGMLMQVYVDPTLGPVETRYYDTTDTLAGTVPGTMPVADTDDAPFATAELERLLRAFDRDAGSVPSRLWDVVNAFDPLKLVTFDPYRVEATAQALFNDASLSAADADDEPQMLTAAQHLASIARRLVTTDSYDLPVPSDQIATKLAYGADGLPGLPGFDDNGDGTIDDALEINMGTIANGTDDYGVVMGDGTTFPDPPTNGRLLDYARYRIVLELKRKGLIDPTTPATDPGVDTAVNAILYGGVWTDQQSTPRQHLESGGLLAPEVIAGQRMDLNRPFGDGRDNAGNGLDDDGNGLVDEPGEVGDPFDKANGIVDEPAEAGEPFLDTRNAVGDLTPDGKYEPGEPYIDVDGNNSYTPPRDQLWQDLTAEPIAFDHTNGHGEAIHPAMATALGSNGLVRNLSSQARQLYARQLYCLMLLLMDDNYVETQNVLGNDEGNVNLLFYLDDVALQIAQDAGRTKATTADYDAAKPLVLRKLTARRIAQWAINCADFRDADAIMTPFEYDENPWDGWGCPDKNGVIIPLDGDVATDENKGQVIDWKAMLASGSNTKAYTVVSIPDEMAKRTRGVVWGAERPELLITETLAFHDRRATDESGSGTGVNNRSIFDPASSITPPDYDLDQRLKPRGSLFVELYNPWSPDGEKPAELYGQVDLDPGTGPNDVQLSEPGVMLNRLSNAADPDTGKFSPVWRIAVLRDPIGGRLTDQLLQLLQTDPDGFGIDMDQHAERWVYFTSGEMGGDINRDNDGIFAAETAGIPAEWQLVDGKLEPQMDQIKVRVPPVPYRAIGEEPYPAGKRYFIARTDRQPSATPNDQDVAIAPILPGRYAVVGSSGMQLTGPEMVATGIKTVSTPAGGPGSGERQRFVTPMSRLPGSSSDEQTDPQHRGRLDVTRRIELWPIIDPNEQQLLVGENGGQEFVRVDDTNYANVTDGDLDGVPGWGNAHTTDVDVDDNGTPDVQATEPCVAIPVEDMNISEPLEGYPSLAYQYKYADIHGTPLTPSPVRLNADGEWEYTTIYDRPLDLEFELERNGTTQKYKTLHLQRLANPTLPWNPPPFNPDGTPNILHQHNLPVNPYRTIDSMSCDLTAYNGASEYERTSLPTTEAMNDTQLQIGNQDLTQGDFAAPLSIEELKGAPDHVLWALIYVLKKEGINTPATPDVFRKAMDSQPTTIEGYLRQLEQKKGGNPMARDTLLRPRIDKYNRKWDGEWGWSLFRRVLPDDYTAGIPSATPTDFRQRLHMKSLERGGHHLFYDLGKKGWDIAGGWEPRVLWDQEPANFMLLSTTAKVSDMKNVPSRRVLRGNEPGKPPQTISSDNYSTDDGTRSQFYRDHDMFDKSSKHVFDYVVEQTLGFTNEAYAPELDRMSDTDPVVMMSTQKPGAPAIVDAGTADPLETPEVAELKQWNNAEKTLVTPNDELERRRKLVRSTYPWLAWNDRPFVSQDEIMQVPASSSSLMLRDYSVINAQTPNPYDGSITDNSTGTTTADRYARQQAPFGHLLNFFMTWILPAEFIPPATKTAITLSGAPNYYRILDYVDVPSRYVGTDTMLSPEVFNDDPTRISTPTDLDDVTGPADPRYNFQPPFNKVSRERDPGRVNLNTVVGRREVVGGVPHIWSEVYDGIMHRYQDGNQSATQLGHLGPAWRDVVLSRKGYAQYNASDPPMDNPLEKPSPGAPPDVFTFGLNRGFPTVFANPFRSPDAGDLVPLPQMKQHGVDASWLRVHPRTRGEDGVWGAPNLPGVDDDSDGMIDEPFEGDDDANGLLNDSRDAGFGDDAISHRGMNAFPAIPVEEFENNDRTYNNPLFSETAAAPSIDPLRNPYMMYQPMTRLGNLVTTRSGVYAVWVTVGYFEVEKAPNWNDPVNDVREGLRRRFGATNQWDNDADPQTIAARALYDRVYPEGYMLGPEMGSDTGNLRRERAFYIIDRTRPVGFKPGEDLNVENTILVRRRIE